MIPSWASQTIIRLRAGTKIERGSAVPDWDNPSSVTISNVSVQPSSSSINVDGRVLGLSDAYTVFCNPGVDVMAGDHIVYEDKTFIVNEDPRSWHSASGAVSNVQFTMVRWAN